MKSQKLTAKSRAKDRKTPGPMSLLPHLHLEDGISVVTMAPIHAENQTTDKPRGGKDQVTMWELAAIKEARHLLMVTEVPHHPVTEVASVAVHHRPDILEEDLARLQEAVPENHGKCRILVEGGYQWRRKMKMIPQVPPDNIFLITIPAIVEIA